MAAKVDKVLVTNITALKMKYGAAGVTQIKKGVSQLVAADKKRGLTTKLVALDDAKAMKTLKAKVVTQSSNAQQNKTAIDGVYQTLLPDYLMILGAPDVVPHQALANPVSGDPDNVVDSDLPYACNVPYSTNISDFVGPTRVVGRLPDLAGAKTPGALIDLLTIAANYQSRPRSDYDDYLGISADVWKNSTSLSLKNLFGSSSQLQLSPPNGPNWTAAQLSRRSHFINCHGSPADPKFYGQKGTSYPVAHAATRLTADVSEGTVVAAECCYGAELYAPALASNQAGICQTYLASRAYGFWGSSTIAYGPASGNGQADLVCQYFLKHVLEGASLGRAALQARQDFLMASGSLDPVELKTFAQFNLMGDPAIHAVAVSAIPHGVTASFAKSKPISVEADLFASRGLRRTRLLQMGLQLPSLITSAVKKKVSLKKNVRDAIQQSAAAFQILAKDLTFSSFEIPSPKLPAGAKALAATLAPAAIHVAIGVLPETGATKAITDLRQRHLLLVMAREEEGRVHISELFSR